MWVFAAPWMTQKDHRLEAVILTNPIFRSL